MVIPEGENTKDFLSPYFKDISKYSATKQILLGASSGWLTGYLAIKVGKTAALALGGGIILLQVANEKGFIKVNWDKVNKKLDKVSDKLEEQVFGQGPSWADKAERFVNRKADKLEDKLTKGKNTAKKWYSGIIGDQPPQVRDIHVFTISFIAGVALGFGTA